MGVAAGNVEGPGLVTTLLLPFDLVLIGPPGHRLAAGPPAPFAELASEYQLVTRAGERTVPGQILERLAMEHGVRLQAPLELGDVDTLLQAVSSGIGVTATDLPSVAQRLARNDMVVLQVEGFPIRMGWHLVHRGHALAPPARLLRDFLARFPWPSGVLRAQPGVLE